MKLNLSDSVLIEIGKVIVVFNLIEEGLSELIGSIVTIGGKLPLEEFAAILSVELSFKQRVGACDSLIRLYVDMAAKVPGFEKLNTYPGPDVMFQYWERVRKLIQHCEEARNTIAHSQYSVSSPDAELHYQHKVTAKQKKGLSFKKNSFRTDELQKTATLMGYGWGAIGLFTLGLERTDAERWNLVTSVLDAAGY